VLSFSHPKKEGLEIKERRLCPLDTYESTTQYIGGMASRSSCEESLNHR